MNVAETGRLLARIAGHDGREVGEAMVLAWHEVLAKVPYELAGAAVVRHFSESTEWLMAAHVVQLARKIYDERRRQALDEIHDERLELADQAHDTAATVRDRAADVQALLRPRPHDATLRRVDNAGTMWAWSCTCGLNPERQQHPSKDAARAAHADHVPASVVVG